MQDVQEVQKDTQSGKSKILRSRLPAGLKKLTPPLEVLIDFLEIDPFLVAAAAERSPNLLPLKGQDFAPLISRLTRQECDDFLLKIVHAEPGAVAALRKRLLSVEQPKPTSMHDHYHIPKGEDNGII